MSDDDWTVITDRVKTAWMQIIEALRPLVEAVRLVPAYWRDTP